MDPQCEIIGKYVLPVYRSLLAKELVEKHNFSQTQAAKRLGTTQPAISQYLNSKRAFKGIEHVEQFLPKIQAMASETAEKIVHSDISIEEVTFDFCHLCNTFCKKEPTNDSPAPEYYI